MEKVRVVNLRTYRVEVVPKRLDFRDYYLPRSIAIRIYENFDEVEVGTNVEEMSSARVNAINGVRVGYHRNVPFDPKGIPGSRGVEQGLPGLMGPVDLRTQLPGPPGSLRIRGSHF
jgi:hypothetical protein